MTFSSNNVKARWDVRRSMAFGAITNAYQLVGTLFSQAPRIIKIVNATDATIDVSQNGTDNNDVLLPNTAFVYDLTANKSEQGGYMFLPINSGIYIKYQAAPSLGAVYVVVIYAADQ